MINNKNYHMVNGYIYIMKNKINGKKYVGQTIQEKPDIRVQQHFMEAYEKNRVGYNRCLNRGIRKYGADAFDWGVLADNIEDEDKLNLLEEYFIDIYNSKTPYGYNMNDGGRNRNSDVNVEIPDDDYSDNSKVILDEISDEDVEKLLKELG